MRGRRPVSRRIVSSRVLGSLLVLASALAACRRDVRDAPALVDAATDEPRVSRSPLPGAALVLLSRDTPSTQRGERVFRVEVASTNAARERGLMGRETLAEQAGMLFVYRAAERRSFWMKDCLIGLDIAFLDVDGRVLRAVTLPPGVGLTGDDVPSAACDGPVMYVLEVRARTFAVLGVGSGDVIDVRAAIEGVVPE